MVPLEAFADGARIREEGAGGGVGIFVSIQVFGGARSKSTGWSWTGAISPLLLIYWLDTQFGPFLSALGNLSLKHICDISMNLWSFGSL